MDKLWTWLLFRVLLGLVPVFANGLRLHLDSQPFTSAALLGRGELLLMVCAVALGAIGELLGVGQAPHQWAKKLLGCCAAASVFGGALFFSHIAGRTSLETRFMERSIAGAAPAELAQIARASDFNKKSVANASMIMYGFTVLTAAASIAYSEKYQS